MSWVTFYIQLYWAHKTIGHVVGFIFMPICKPIIGKTIGHICTLEMLWVTFCIEAYYWLTFCIMSHGPCFVCTHIRGGAKSKSFLRKLFEGLSHGFVKIVHLYLLTAHIWICWFGYFAFVNPSHLHTCNDNKKVKAGQVFNVWR